MSNKSVQVFGYSGVRNHPNTSAREHVNTHPNTLTPKHFENLLCAV
jgi:hypothetical protein